MTPVKSVAAEPFAHEPEPFERLLDSGEAAQLL